MTNGAVQPLKPLLIGAKPWEGRGEVAGDEFVGLLEGSDAEETLHEADGDDFGIGEGGRGVRRGAPSREGGRFVEEVINEAEDVGHLVYNGSQRGRPPSVGKWFAPLFYTLSELWRPNLSTQYSG